VLDYIHINLSDELQLSALAEVATPTSITSPAPSSRASAKARTSRSFDAASSRPKTFSAIALSPSSRPAPEPGFVDQSHFSKVFRRIVGVSPSQYRQSL
jgi:Bacterial regulatory helix-turn-helix proteins, AraC family